MYADLGRRLPEGRRLPAANPNLELRQQILRLLEKRDGAVLRTLRAIEAVEHLGTAEAREVLATLSQDSPNPAWPNRPAPRCSG
jgi:hypothetical protein